MVNYVSFTTKIFNIFKSLIENVSVRGEGKSVYQLRAQVLRVAANRVPPLALRLREGPIIFRPGPTYYGGAGW